ncbi:uncharacterized protein LOC111712445 [Eurytemora carolleeae]|uniref:uncharacterized protein LOC111712445 n=1 Tax=Eurytemora carolleeae TaxID=1294199 RepID=UPI000C7938AE|nr:uncharacterized protein LOC111712445 [Eurytemora carolleeae]|eukprot:XP_023342813.1 uncharacterized protein LOC111712445 [Eurytemora affinis]
MVPPLILVQLVLLLPGIVLPMSDDSFIHFPLSSPEDCVDWVPAREGEVPAAAFIADFTEKDGGHQGVYIGRAEHEGGKFPGTFLPALEKAFIAWGGKVHHKDHYEVLVEKSNLLQCRLVWINSRDGQLDDRAVIGGYTENGEDIYIYL